MSFSPIEQIASQRIGTVEYVSPDEIRVGLDLEAPDGIAANVGIPRVFPRINGYVLITTDTGYIVSQVEWIVVERSPFPKRRGLQDYGLIDLPFPLRKMRINPLGILKKVNNEDNYSFKRGVQTLPSVGEPVLLPTDNQLRSIVESGQKKRVKIGTSPLAANADVYVDPDRLFGRHLAILGNTGSGKSCSVAGLIQWSLDSAEKTNNISKRPNSRFIILDPNGEYDKVFGHKGRIFKVNDTQNPLLIPLWFWNSTEWCSFTQAKPGAQVPLLRQALRSMRNEEHVPSKNKTTETRRFIGNILRICITNINSGLPFDGKYNPMKSVVDPLKNWGDSLARYQELITEDLSPIINELNCLYKRHLTVSSNGYKEYYTFTPQEFDELISCLKSAFISLGGNEQELLLKHEDIPIKFQGEEFVNCIEALSQNSGNEQYFEFLITRIRTMLANTQMEGIVGDKQNITLESWLCDYLGDNSTPKSCAVVIDLSLVPNEIIHITTSVIARMILEALQRYWRIKEESLPTVLVMEEAHNFIKRYKEDTENPNAASICCQIFEKIAREGRKFGLGLVLSSQRPSELSPTVLSQCNSFLLHRISNDKDQEIVGRLVPDNLRGLLKELPSLPSQQAILLGWAAELPIMVRMNDLNPEETPLSNDPDFWNVWTGIKEREVDWKKIADDWQQIAELSQDMLTDMREEPLSDCNNDIDEEDSPEIIF